MIASIPTGWFLAFGLVALLAALFGGYRLLMRGIVGRAVELQREVERRKRTEAQLARAVADLEERNVELRFKNEELERFSYSVSHDLKSPVVTIKGFLGLLRQDVRAGDVERLEADLAAIDGAAETMHQVLIDLFELSRAGRKTGPWGQVASAEIAREAVAGFAEPIAARGIEVEIAADLPRLVGDRYRLLQVLQHLVENAVKFLGEPEEPRIEIGWRPGVGDENVFYVRDNGIGIDPRYHEKVFGLFERLDATSDSTGVGLALVQRIVELHGGRVWVESEGDGTGSTFSFNLPGRRPFLRPASAPFPRPQR